jgi:hypothetical protein
MARTTQQMEQKDARPVENVMPVELAAIERPASQQQRGTRREGARIHDHVVACTQRAPLGKNVAPAAGAMGAGFHTAHSRKIAFGHRAWWHGAGSMAARPA